MAKSSAFSVVRQEVWPALVRGLEEASRSGVRAASRDVLKRPVELLSLMAADAIGALGDDVLAAERMRMLLYLTAPFAARVEEARAVVERTKNGEASYEPGALDHGALLLVALAAVRVAPPSAPNQFIRNVHGIALSAAPAEVLSRLVPRMPEAGGLAIILDTLYLLDTVGTALNAVLRPFDSDPAERGRWHCLDRLLQRDLDKLITSAAREVGHSGSPPWVGATANGIEEVLSQHAGGKPVVLLRGHFKEIRKGGSLAPGVQLVFVTPNVPPRSVRVISLEANQIIAEAPETDEEGWFGFSDDRRIEAARAFRDALRSAISRELESNPRVRGSHLAPHLIPSVGTPDPQRADKWLGTPPRTASNRFGGTSEASVKLAAPDEEPSQPLATRIVSLRALQRGEESPLWEGELTKVEVLLDGVLDDDLSLYLDPSPEGGEPLHSDRPQGSQRALFDVPASAVHDGLVLTAVLGSASDAYERKTLGPLQFCKQREVRLVVVQPQVVTPPQTPIDREALLELLKSAASPYGIRPTLLDDLPWVDDELAVLATPIHSAEDARVPQLLEVLSRRAMLTPNLESAVWICLVPDESCIGGGDNEPVLLRSIRQGNGKLLESGNQGRGFHRFEPAEAARGVVVANPFGLPALFAEMLPADGRAMQVSAPVARLRVLGTMSIDGVYLQPVREEVRSRGPGARQSSGLSIVSLDERGRELSVEPLRSIRLGSPAQLAVLLPIDATVSAVEVRKGNHVLTRIDRIAGDGRFERAELDAPTLAEQQRLRWQFRHTLNARPDLALAIGKASLQTEVLRLDACDERPKIHLTRYAKGTVELTATDGWNGISRDVVGLDGQTVKIENPYPVQIRKLCDGRWFPDVPKGFQVAWSLEGRRVKPERDQTVSLPSDARGVLRLEATRAGAVYVVDERAVEEG